MKTRKFYRIEDERGRGMYRSWAAPDCVQEMQPGVSDKGNKRHPTPNSDETLWEQAKDAGLVTYYNDFHSKAEKFFFGFTSKKQLKAWIFKKEWRKKLANSELMLVTFQASEYIIGETQVMFVKNEATKTIIPWETVI